MATKRKYGWQGIHDFFNFRVSIYMYTFMPLPAYNCDELDR